MIDCDWKDITSTDSEGNMLDGSTNWKSTCKSSGVTYVFKHRKGIIYCKAEGSQLGTGCERSSAPADEIRARAKEIAKTGFFGDLEEGEKVDTSKDPGENVLSSGTSAAFCAEPGRQIMPVQQWIATVKTCCEMNGGQYAPGPTDCVIGGRMPGDRAGHLRCAAQLEDVCVRTRNGVARLPISVRG